MNVNDYVSQIPFPPASMLFLTFLFTPNKAAILNETMAGRGGGSLEKT